MISRAARGFVAFLAAAMLLPSLLFLRAEAAVPDPGLTVPQAICCQLESGEILYAKGEKDLIAPAAFTKLMTALLVYEYRKEKGNIPVTITPEMIAGAAGTGMDLKAGEEVPLDSLLAGLCVAGANDAALALASAVGGNIPAFVEQMNARAAALGMADTVFANPTGLDSPVMRSTLGDILILCREVYRVNDFMVLSSQKSVTLPATNLSGERTLQNRNRVLYHHYVYPYYIPDSRGMAYGVTESAGYCIATTREKNGGTTLVLLSGGQDLSEKHNELQINALFEAKTLLEWAETNFRRIAVVSEGTVIREEAVSLAAGVDHMILVAGETLHTYLEKDLTLASLTSKVVLTDSNFVAPVVKGQVFGRIEYYQEDRLIGSVPLVAQSNIGRSQASALWSGVKRFFSTGPAFVILILVILVAASYVVILIITVIRQNLKANQERRLAARRLEQEENRRLQKVRREERARRDVRLRSAGSFFREGFRVMTGSAAAGNATRTPQKGVARVPEKYRKYPQGTKPPQRSVAPSKTPAAKRPPAQRPDPRRRPPQNQNARRNERKK